MMCFFLSRVFHGIVTVQEHRGLTVQQGGAKVGDVTEFDLSWTVFSKVLYIYT